MRGSPLLPGSVRARLTLGSVLALGLILVVLGGVLLYTARAGITDLVDRDLARRADRFVRDWPPPENAPPRRRDRTGDAAANRPPRPPLEDIRPATAGEGAGGVDVESRPAYWFKVLDLQERMYFSGRSDAAWDRAAFVRAVAGETGYSTVVWDGEPIRVFSTPLRREGRVEGVLQIGRPLAEIDRVQERLARAVWTLVPLALLAAGGGGAYLTARALRPVRDLTRAAGHIEARNLSERLPALQGGDEFSELAATFNGMLARLEASFEQQRRFTADASHELRTPLTVILGDASWALSAERTGDEYRQALESVRQSAGRMRRIVQDLLFLAGSDAGRLPMEAQPLPLGAILEDAAESAAGAAKEGSATAPVRLDLPEGETLEVFGDADHLVRLFTNLIGNAARHTPPDGAITVTARPADGGTGAAAAEVVVTVADTGEGIAPEHLPHVFERFYRADGSRARSGGGTGLGLAISKTIVEAHGGTIRIESAPGRGTVVTVTLPRP